MPLNIDLDAHYGQISHKWEKSIENNETDDCKCIAR